MKSRTTKVRRGSAAARRDSLLGLLIPGHAQWRGGRPERGIVFFGSFLSALGVGLFTWGTWGGMVLLAFAFGAHVVSTAEFLRASAFPGFGRVVPWASASMGLGMICYAPALALASMAAWPGLSISPSREGYLVNRWAFHDREPVAGENVWVKPNDGRGGRTARVMAASGQQVEWNDDKLTVDGRLVPWSPPRSAWRPRDLSFKVPEGRVLVAVDGPERPNDPAATALGLEVVDSPDVVGKVWARLYPIWNRHLIP